MSNQFYNRKESGRPLTIKSNGITLSTNVSELDFTGAGQTGSAIGNIVTEDIAGGGGGVAVSNEIPAGAVDGNNQTFTLLIAPIADSEHVYLAGVRQQKNVDYSILGNVITFVIPPQAPAVVTADYSLTLASIVIPYNTAGMPGLYVKQYALMVYDFNIDGGAQGTLVPTGSPVFPANSIVRLTSYDVVTPLTSGTDSADFDLEFPVDGALLNGTSFNVPSWNGGPDTLSTALTGHPMYWGLPIKLTANRQVQMKIQTEDLTAGKVVFNFEYWISQI